MLNLVNLHATTITPLNARRHRFQISQKTSAHPEFVPSGQELTVNALELKMSRAVCLVLFDFHSATDFVQANCAELSLKGTDKLPFAKLSP